MGHVETCRGAVTADDIWIVPGKVSPSVVVGPVDSLGVGIGPLDHQTVRELATGGNLEGVIIGA